MIVPDKPFIVGPLETKEEQKEVQQLFFDLGFVWNHGKKNYLTFDKTIYIGPCDKSVRKDGRLMYSTELLRIDDEMIIPKEKFSGKATVDYDI